MEAQYVRDERTEDFLRFILETLVSDESADAGGSLHSFEGFVPETNKRKSWHLKGADEWDETGSDALTEYGLWDTSDYRMQKGRTMDNDTEWTLSNMEHRAWAAQRWSLRSGRVSDPEWSVDAGLTAVMTAEVGCQTALSNEHGPLLYRSVTGAVPPPAQSAADSAPLMVIDDESVVRTPRVTIEYEHAFDALLAEHLERECAGRKSTRMSRATQTRVNRRLYLDAYYTPTSSALANAAFMRALSHDLHFDYLSLCGGCFGRRLPWIFPVLDESQIESLRRVTAVLRASRQRVSETYLRSSFQMRSYIPDFFAAQDLLGTAVACRGGFESAIRRRHRQFSTYCFSRILEYLTGFPRRRALAICRSLQFGAMADDFVDAKRAPFHRSQMRFVMRLRTMMHSVDTTERHSEDMVRLQKAEALTLDSFQRTIMADRVAKARRRAELRRLQQMQDTDESVDDID